MLRTENVGNVDRIIRIVVGLVLLVAGFATLPGLWSWVMIVLGAIAAGTALLRTCPLYSLLGVSTCPRRSAGGF